MTNGSFLYYKVGDSHKSFAETLSSILHELEGISVLRVSKLDQVVSIPDLKVSVTRSHNSCLVPGDNALIYVSSTADPDLAITALSRHISELFDATPYTHQIHQLLVTDDTDTLLRDTFQLPPVPDSVEVLRIDESEIGTDLFEDALEEIVEDGCTPPSILEEPEEMEDVVVETAEAACQDEYRDLISVVNRDFQERLKHQGCQGLPRGPKTGFAGELLVVLTINLTDIRSFSCWTILSLAFPRLIGRVNFVGTLG
jgi:hypothetical protein